MTELVRPLVLVVLALLLGAAGMSLVVGRSGDSTDLRASSGSARAVGAAIAEAATSAWFTVAARPADSPIPLPIPGA